MTSLITALQGKKTYLVGIAGVLYVASGYVLGKGINYELLLTSLGLMGLRDAIAKGQG